MVLFRSSFFGELSQCAHLARSLASGGGAGPTRVACQLGGGRCRCDRLDDAGAQTERRARAQHLLEWPQTTTTSRVSNGRANKRSEPVRRCVRLSVGRLLAHIRSLACSCFDLTYGLFPGASSFGCWFARADNNEIRIIRRLCSRASCATGSLHWPQIPRAASLIAGAAAATVASQRWGQQSQAAKRSLQQSLLSALSWVVWILYHIIRIARAQSQTNNRATKKQSPSLEMPAQEIRGLNMTTTHFP